MGLTVNYAMSSRLKSRNGAMRLVDRVRRLALDLPLEQVGEVQVLGAETCNKPYAELKASGDLWPILHAEVRISPPWARKEQGVEIMIRPLEIILFHCLPAGGTESAEFGLASYPKTVRATWGPEDDRRFQSIVRSGEHRYPSFDLGKWFKYREVAGLGHRHHADCREEREINTRLGGWKYSASCKTELAAAEEYGGFANFLRGHVALVTLLERAGRIPGLNVDYFDEARYGRHEGIPPEGNFDVTPLARFFGKMDYLGQCPHVSHCNRSGELDDARVNAFLGALGAAHAPAYGNSP